MIYITIERSFTKLEKKLNKKYLNQSVEYYRIGIRNTITLYYNIIIYLTAHNSVYVIWRCSRY